MNYIQNWILVIVVLIALSSCSNNQTDTFTVKILNESEVADSNIQIILDNGKDIYQVNSHFIDGELIISDSAYASYIQLTLTVNEASELLLIQAGEEGEIQIHSDQKPFSLINVTTMSKSGGDKYAQEVQPLELSYQNFFQSNLSLIQANDSAISEMLSIRLEELNQAKLDFVNKYPNAYKSFDVFEKYLLKSSLSDEILIETFENSFTTEMKNSYEGQELKKYIEGKKIKPGTVVPDYNLVDIDGYNILSQNYTGEKAVLMVFWATWCPFCQAEVPELLDIREEYPEEFLEMITISLDWDEQTFINGVEKHNMDWKHIFGRHDLANSFGFSSLPAYVLINKEGIIDLKEEALRESDIENLKIKLKDTIKS